MSRDHLTILIDTREQLPLAFGADVLSKTVTLTTGDYSLEGFTEHCAIERKELGDLIGCITTSRERFKAELIRMRGYRCRAVVIEASLADILAGRYCSEVHPSAVLGSIASWTTRYTVPFIFAGDRVGAAAVVMAMLKTYRQQVAEIVNALNCHTNGMLDRSIPSD